MKGMGAKIMLLVALLLATGTSYVVYRYVQQADALHRPVETVQVVTAAKDIPTRTLITNDMLRLSAVPIGVALPQASTKLDQVVGRVARQPISQGEQILNNKIYASREETGLAFTVPPGKRAIAVGVDEVVGSGGNIVPGDFVDVVAVIDTKENKDEQQQSQQAAPSAPPAPGRSLMASLPTRSQISAVAQFVLQDVEVLAVAQQIEGDTSQGGVAGAVQTLVPGRTQSSTKPDVQPQPQAHTVTLSVAPEDVQKVILAENKGKIRLVLRAYGDEATVRNDDEGLIGTVNGHAVLKNDLGQ